MLKTGLPFLVFKFSVIKCFVIFFVTPVFSHTLIQITLHDWEGTIRHGAVWENTPISELNNDVNSEVIQFGKLSPMVKINRLPGMYQLGRKDNLYLVKTSI